MHFNKFLPFTSLFINNHINILIAVSIYCCFMKYQAKQITLVPYYYTISELKEIRY